MGFLPAKKELKKNYDIDSYYLNLASNITNRKNVITQKQLNFRQMYM
jgi:chloramphenicol O-acetyltransferase